jgi:pimeloyl-ACP methyl ester carboxylesterase
MDRDYTNLDRPEVLMNLSHPRREWTEPDESSQAQDVMIPVEPDVMVGARFHIKGKPFPNILFFHGNGEIVADYDELGPLYNRMDINFLPVDYRGYGRSSGSPTVSTMMKDCHVIFEYIDQWLRGNGYTGSMIVMGRSLGSASALELVGRYGEKIAALIIESGFAYAGPLLRLLGVDPDRLGYSEEKGFGNLNKIKRFEKPTLIIHAERDHIIPFSDGEALYDASPAPNKMLLKIPNANHNDIFSRELTEYLNAVKTLVRTMESSIF